MSEGEHMGNCLGRNRILTVLGFFRLFFASYQTSSDIYLTWVENNPCDYPDNRVNS